MYKTLSGGTVGQDDEMLQIFTSAIKASDHAAFDRVRLAPVLLQERIPKRHDIRVTVVDEWLVAVSMDPSDVPDATDDWRRARTEELNPQPHQLPPEIQRRCIALVRALDLRFGAIDLIETSDGEYGFLEINPNGQWAWLDLEVQGLNIREHLAELLVTGKAVMARA
jgi:glutathione synthase/RimK-type ligase-like ATP-grasp enzyme